MAQQIPCDICEAEPAAMVLTMVMTGDTQGVGFRCLEEWAFGFGQTLRDQREGANDTTGAESPEPNLAAVAVTEPPADADSGQGDGEGSPAPAPVKAPPRKRAAKAAAAS